MHKSIVYVLTRVIILNDVLICHSKIYIQKVLNSLIFGKFLVLNNIVCTNIHYIDIVILYDIII